MSLPPGHGIQRAGAKRSCHEGRPGRPNRRHEEAGPGDGGLVFSFGELGFQEFETSRYLSGILEREGFHIHRGVAGIPTAWVASWGQGKPVISLGSDIDDIPQASQKPGVAWHEPLIEGAPGHGEGHNSGVPLNIIAALAVKKVMEREHLKGTLRLWPGVAEEELGSKAYYVRAGLFKDVDVCLFAHVSNNFSVTWGGSLNTNGLVSVEYLFKGESAHAAGAPWRGRSALDAVELMDAGWNFRREHLRLAQRSHYVITNGGDQPNVVPPSASVWYYFREADYDFAGLWLDFGGSGISGQVERPPPEISCFSRARGKSNSKLIETAPSTCACWLRGIATTQTPFLSLFEYICSVLGARLVHLSPEMVGVRPASDWDILEESLHGQISRRRMAGPAASPNGLPSTQCQ
jgi:hypothetical protein